MLKEQIKLSQEKSRPTTHLNTNKFTNMLKNV